MGMLSVRVTIDETTRSADGHSACISTAADGKFYPPADCVCACQPRGRQDVP